MNHTVTYGLFVAALCAPHSAGAQTPHDASAPVSDVAWSWDGPEPQYRHFVPGALVEARGEHGERCVFRYTEASRSTRVACSGGRVTPWHVEQGDAFVEDAALLVEAGTLYVLRYCAISSGATLSAYDLVSGARRWSTALRALGPVAHSEYLNASQVRRDHGRLAVFGWESSGRYIEIVDPATGATLANQRLAP